MLGKERIEINKCFFVRITLKQGGTSQTSVGCQRLTVLAKKRYEGCLTLGRFRQQPLPGDLTDVSRIKFQRDWEAIAQLCQFSRVVGCSFENFCERLLPGGYYPHMPLPKFFETAC